MFEKRMASAVLTLIMLFALIFPGQTLASTTPTVNRLAGQDRYETAATIAKQWSHSDYAILVSGENYPDALASAPLAQKHKAPILLTASDSLPAPTKQALADLEVNQVIIIGGTGVIAPSMEAELQAMGISTTRLAGQNRYETALKIADQVQSSPSQLFVCTGDDFADALSVAPIAAIEQIPIILVSGDSLASSVQEYLDLNSAHITKTFVIGYSDVIRDQVAGQFPHVERIVGADKYARNIAVNEQFNHLFSTEALCIANGEGFADALAGSALAAQKSQPILLVNNATPDTTKKYYQQRLAGLEQITVFGGTEVIPDQVIQNLQSAADLPSDNVQPPADLTSEIWLDKTYIHLLQDQSATLTVYRNTPEGPVKLNNYDLIWSSSNPMVKANYGHILGFFGSTTLTVKTEDGHEASCRVIVVARGIDYRTLILSDYTKLGAGTATFKFQVLDYKTNKDITAELSPSALLVRSPLNTDVSLDLSKGIGTITFNTPSDIDKPFTLILFDAAGGLESAVGLVNPASSADSARVTYPVGDPDYISRPVTPPIDPNQKVGEIIITSTKLGATDTTGYATYIVKDQDGRDVTRSSYLVPILEVTGDVGISFEARNGLLTVHFGPDEDPSSIPEVTITITDSRSGVSTTATLEIVPQYRVISP